MSNRRYAYFLSKHWPAVVLFFFGIFLIFVRSSGSLDGDEAIYAQVARESLSHDSWLTLYWRDNVWMEKPPFFLWCQMIALSWFGLSEVAIRFSPGLFGVLTSILAYFTVWDLFRNRKGAFVAGLILFSTPLFIDSMRHGMTDTALTFFITLSIFSVYKSIFSSARWLRIFGLSTGFAVMTKGAVGLIPIIILTVAIFFVCTEKTAIKKEIFYSVAILFVVVFPWHAYMSMVFGAQFWKEYFHYHVLSRFTENIILSPYNNYGEVALNRLGIWAIIFLVLFFGTAKVFFKKYKKEIIFFLSSAIFIVSIFSFSKTVSPHYILPTLPLVAIIMGGIIGEVFEKEKRFAIVIASVALLNFTPFLVLQASNYGGSNIFIPRIFDHFFNYPNASEYLLIVLFVTIFYLSGLILYEKNKKSIIFYFLVLVGMNIFIPFYSDRSSQMKEVGAYISAQEKELSSCVLMSESKKHLTNTLLFYLPVDMTTERIGTSCKADLEDGTLCVILKEDSLYKEFKGRELYVFKDGAVFQCKAKGTKLVDPF